MFLYIAVEVFTLVASEELMHLVIVDVPELIMIKDKVPNLGGNRFSR
ncbi:Uncharacterised protein [Chlamydia trachomatis]|nr:Uncharacterised protein [Chlamydia trachomatis]